MPPLLQQVDTAEPDIPLMRDFLPSAASDESDSEAELKRKMEPAYFTNFHKATCTVASTIGQRRLVRFAFALSDVVTHYDPAMYPGVKGLVALTIDDALCRQRGDNHCMATEVGELLAEFSAKATFFLTTDFVSGHEDAMVRLLKAGHEVANHCPQDRPYDGEDEACFEKALLQAEEVCDELRRRAADVPGAPPAPFSLWGCLAEVCAKLCSPAATRSPPHGGPAAVSDGRATKPQRWFRPPVARYSTAMVNVWKRNEFKVVLGDCYANDPYISDPDFIASTMLQHANDGSVMVIHMPERGFREYNYDALRKVLEGLQQRNMQVVTLNALHETATAGGELRDSPMRNIFRSVVQNYL